MPNIVIADVQAEKMLLGAILVKPESLTDLKDKLAPDDFYRQEHKIIFQAMLNLVDDMAIDMTTVSDEIRRMGKDLKRIAPVLVECNGIEYTSSFSEKYASIILDCSKRRQIIDLGREMSSKAADMGESVDIGGYQQRLSKIHFGNDDDGMLTAYDATMRFTKWMEEECMKEHSGIMTGFDAVDNLVLGFPPKYLIILAARPSMGKTAFAVNMVRNIARDGRKIAMYSQEMATEQVMARIIACETGIDSAKLLQPKVMNSAEWDKAVQSYNEISQLPMYITDSCAPIIEDICASARKTKAKWGLDAIIIDHLQLINGKHKEDNRVKELGYISKALKSLAKELKISVIVLSQLSRAVEARNNKRPMMSDLRDSGELEQDADIVISMYRDLYYNKNGDPWTEIGVLKNRNGPVGTARLMFVPQLSRFDPMENDFGGQIVNDVPV